jgi:CRISPR/Cas system-associated exonuclease Cas4 (RecB family)
VEEIDALSRGSLIHDVQYELLTELRDEGALPVTEESLHSIWERMEPVRERVVARFEDELSPAIRRVWDDAMSEIRADLREWLRCMSEHPAWVPDRFELSFGLSGREAMDVHSTKDPVKLDCGIALRGAIDLIERGPEGIRVTDYKTGKARMKQNAVVQGGEILQPVLYALAAEQLFPDDPVLASRLWFCTARGGFQERGVLLDEATRAAAKLVVETIGEALETGFLPAAPRKDACRWCDYKVICGPHEEQRTRTKPRKQIENLLKLREAP